MDGFSCLKYAAVKSKKEAKHSLRSAPMVSSSPRKGTCIADPKLPFPV